jgi:hypothetical protein
MKLRQGYEQTGVGVIHEDWEVLEQPASYGTQISCSHTLEPINFSALNRFRLKAG